MKKYDQQDTRLHAAEPNRQQIILLQYIQYSPLLVKSQGLLLLK
jgi:hypothetical protein